MKPRLYTLFFLLILSLSSILIILSLKKIRFFLEADEGYYLKYAQYISKNGIKKYPDLFRDYLKDEKNYIFPPPLRIGFILLSSISIKIFGNNPFSLLYLSLFSYCLFISICFYFAYKYFGEKIALLFIILLAFSPINMAMARRILVDSTFNFFSCLSIWLFFDLINKRTNLKYLLFILIYSFTILVKEPGILLSLVFFLYLLFYKFLFKEKIYLKDFFSIVFPFIIVGFIYLLAGGFSNTIDTIKVILTSPKTNSYAILFQSGPWFRYIIDYILISPWVIILSIGFLFYCFISKEFDERIIYFLLVLIVLFLSLNIFCKNLRYAMILDMPMRLFSVLILKKLFKVRFPFILILVITISIFDYINFYDLFVEKGIYDPISFLLLKAKRIIP